MTFSKAAVSALLLQAVSASLYGESSSNHTCQLSPSVLSCSPQADPAITDSCCAETFGGLILSTQFWSTYTGLESKGQVLPKDSWSLHGLWPDFCNGSYTQYCDLNRQYDPTPSPNTTTGTSAGLPVPPYTGPNVGTFLEAFGKYDLLAFMNKYWINQGAPNTDFWAHEFSKHGTCYSTFDVPCYGPQYTNHSDVIDFYETAVSYYLNVPTWGWLGSQGIYPSNTTSYTLSSIQAALTQGFGAIPYLGCTGPKFNTTAAGNGTLDNGRTVLDEVWYYHYVYGRVQRNQAVAVPASINGGSLGNCATSAGAIHYYERSVGSESTS